MITMTESALKKSFIPVTLRKFNKMNVDEGFLFIPLLPVLLRPSPGSIDEENGDGHLVEIWDYAHDLSWVDAENREVSTGAATIIYVKKDDVGTKLNPCPLCGRKPVISQDEDRGGIGGPVLTDWVIECRCGLTLSAAKRETATRRWNRRIK